MTALTQGISDQVGPNSVQITSVRQAWERNFLLETNSGHKAVFPVQGRIPRGSVVDAVLGDSAREKKRNQRLASGTTCAEAHTSSQDVARVAPPKET